MRKNFLHRRVARQESASARVEERAKRTDEEQLEKLISEGHGDCPEAIKLKGARRE